MKIFVLLFFPFCLLSQINKLEIKPSSGIVFHNIIIKNKYDDELIKGWSNINSIDIRITRNVYKYLELSTSIGYMHSYNLGLDIFGINAFSHYTSFKIGGNWNFKNMNTLGIDISNYILSQPRNTFTSHQNKYFVNIDLIYEKTINEYISIGISSPITIVPFASSNEERLGTFENYNLWSGWVGCNLFFSIKII